MGAEWVPKTWEIFNLTTTNAILFCIFIIALIWGGGRRGVGWGWSEPENELNFLEFLRLH